MCELWTLAKATSPQYAMLDPNGALEAQLQIGGGIVNMFANPEQGAFNAGRGFAHTLPLTAATEGVGGLYTRVLGAAELGAVEEIPGFIRYGNRESVFFGQRRAGPTFSPGQHIPEYLRGRLIADVAEDLRAGVLSPDQLPVNVFRNEETGVLISENTPRLER